MTVNSKGTLVEPGKGSTYLVLGDLYTFIAAGEKTDGAYGLLEMTLQPQSITPPHIHDQADEAHYILEGEVEYQVDEQTTVATPGTFLHFSKDQYHGFKNIGSKPAKLPAWTTPPGPELFFAEVGQPVNLPMSEEEQRSLSSPPNPAALEKAVAIATTKYGVKFASA